MSSFLAIGCSCQQLVRGDSLTISRVVIIWSEVQNIKALSSLQGNKISTSLRVLNTGIKYCLRVFYLICYTKTTQQKNRICASFIVANLTVSISSAILNKHESDLALPLKRFIKLYILGIRNTNITRILEGITA